MAPPPESPPQPLDDQAAFDRLSAHWRVVFDAEEDALRAAGHCRTSLAFAPAELRERRERLAREREATARLIDSLAREEHLELTHPLSAPRMTTRLLGLPSGTLACVFDLDGVLTASSAIHAAAWAETFDELLSRRAERTGERFAPFLPFDRLNDYERHIHGKPRLEGVHAFLASRGIRLPEGNPVDRPGAETVHGLGNRKNLALRRRLEHQGVTAFADSYRYLEGVREAGLETVVVSPSTNTAEIVGRAGLTALVEHRVDGEAIRSGNLRSKPEPDTLLAACRLLGIPPEKAAAFETTMDGLAAARAAGFGLVVAVDREGRGGRLRTGGADLTVPDLGALLAQHGRA